MAKFPKIYVTKSGKRYFVVNGRKVYINSQMTKREIYSIYRLLHKTVRKKRNKKPKATNVNTASAVIKQYINTPRTRTKTKPKTRPSTITGNRVTTSGDSRNPKDSGDKDLINSLQNKLLGLTNKLKDPPLIDYSEEGRLSLLKKDPEFLSLLQNPSATEDEFVRLAEKYGLLHLYYGLKRKHDLESPNFYGDPSHHEGEDEEDEDEDKKSEASDDPVKDLMRHSSGFESKEEPATYQDPELNKPPEVNEEVQENVQEDVESRKTEKKSHHSRSHPEPTHESFSDISSEHVAKIAEVESIDDIRFLKKLVNTLRRNNPALKPFITAIPQRANNLDHYRDVLEQELEQSDVPVSNFEYNKAYLNVGEQLREEVNKEKTRKENAEKRKKRFIRSVEKAGKGKSASSGLYDDQIEKIMSHFKDFRGCIMRDEIKNLLPQIRPHSRVAFIINNQDHKSPGQHWDAVYIDARNGPESSNSLEWFDSFARPMPADIREDCKLILKCLKPETILKLKENRIVHQSDDSSNCGYFCCRFLIDRFRGKSFSEASGYDDHVKIDHSKQDEKEIERLKQYPPFNYVLPD